MERAGLASALARWLGPATVAPENGRILISEADPGRFLQTFAAAVATDAEVFLCDPHWGANERAQVAELIRPAAGGGPAVGTRSWERGWLMIPTGGSGGRIKFARHDQETIAVAVRGFAEHFGFTRVNSVGVLPLHHVSGLMAWMRCALTGGDYLPVDWKTIERGPRPALTAPADGWVISLVPTQLERLLRDPAAIAWLQSFRVIFLGGAPTWADLLDRAAEHRLPLSLGYGMTETAAMVTALRPGELLGGDRSNGRPLPHAQVVIGNDSAIALRGGSLFRGYYPDYAERTEFVTQDQGRLDGGRLVVLGRRDGAIISGGEKIQPLEVEEVLRASGEFDDVAVLGLADAEWGQSVVAAYAAARRPDFAKVETLLRGRLAPAKRPKRFVAVPDWPRTAAGKVNRDVLENLVRQAIAREAKDELPPVNSSTPRH